MVVVTPDESVFDMPSGQWRSGFRFIAPGRALSSKDVAVEFVEGRWRLTYRNGDAVIVEEHESEIAALIKIVARLCGFTADLQPLQEDR